MGKSRKESKVKFSPSKIARLKERNTGHSWFGQSEFHEVNAQTIHEHSNIFDESIVESDVQSSASKRKLDNNQVIGEESPQPAYHKKHNILSPLKIRTQNSNMCPVEQSII